MKKTASTLLTIYLIAFLQLQSDTSAIAVGRCPAIGHLQPGVPAAVARHCQRDGRPRADAQGPSGVSAATFAIAAQPVGGLSVPERVFADARFVVYFLILNFGYYNSFNQIKMSIHKNLAPVPDCQTPFLCARIIHRAFIY